MCTKFIHPTDVIQIMCTLCLQKVYKYTSILIKETILYYTKVLVQCMLLKEHALSEYKAQSWAKAVMLSASLYYVWPFSRLLSSFFFSLIVSEILEQASRHVATEEPNKTLFTIQQNKAQSGLFYVLNITWLSTPRNCIFVWQILTVLIPLQISK